MRDICNRMLVCSSEHTQTHINTHIFHLLKTCFRQTFTQIHQTRFAVTGYLKAKMFALHNFISFHESSCECLSIITKTMARSLCPGSSQYYYGMGDQTRNEKRNSKSHILKRNKFEMSMNRRKGGMAWKCVHVFYVGSLNRKAIAFDECAMCNVRMHHTNCELENYLLENGEYESDI